MNVTAWPDVGTASAWLRAALAPVQGSADSLGYAMMLGAGLVLLALGARTALLWWVHQLGGEEIER